MKQKEVKVKPVVYAKKKRVRRSTVVVEKLILDAARKLFAERGYRASTRDIANLAGVPEPFLFRKYGSKPGLFEAAVSEALVSFYKTFDTEHLSQSDSEEGLADRGHLFTNELFELISDNRKLIFSYLSAREFEPELAHMPHSDGLSDYFGRAEKSLKRRYKLLSKEPSIPTSISGRLAFLTVVTAVLCKDWVFADEEFSHDQLVDGLNRFVLKDFAPHPSALDSREATTGVAKTRSRVGSGKAHKKRKAL